MTHASLLTADSIGKRYRRRDVLMAASLWARPGQITALVGRNGAGKSTLLKIAAGWLRADHGIVIFKERRYVHPKLADLARLGLFFLPDRSLLCSIRTIRQHLSAVRRSFPDAAAEEATEVFQLTDLLDRKPPTLSAGERRRAEVGLAWARQPDCLLADEPFRGLAPRDQELIARALRAMASQGVALIATGHEVVTLLDLADEVVWVTEGTTRTLGPPAEARSNFQFMRAYLGPASMTTDPGHRPSTHPPTAQETNVTDPRS